MSKPVRSSSVPKDIARREQANALMRADNLAPARDDVASLLLSGSPISISDR